MDNSTNFVTQRNEKIPKRMKNTDAVVRERQRESTDEVERERWGEGGGGRDRLPPSSGRVKLSPASLCLRAFGQQVGGLLLCYIDDARSELANSFSQLAPLGQAR